MQRVRRGCLIIATAVGLLSASTAFAHIDLLEPEARAHGTAARGDTDIDANSNLKSGPCGQVTSGRTQRVTTYAPGQRITVRVREENAHVSYIRVSIDLDGEDFPLRPQAPSGPETEELAAAAEAELGGDGLLAVYREDNDTPGFIHELDVRLPDVSCTNCTLQVLQFMYDDPAAPHYFQCADLVIAQAGGAQDAGPSANGGSIGTNPNPSGASGAGLAGSAESADGASAPAASPGGAAGVAAASGSASAPAARTTSASESAAAVASDGGDGSGGCSLSRRASGPLYSVSLGLLAFGLGLTRRRR